MYSLISYILLFFTYSVSLMTLAKQGTKKAENGYIPEGVMQFMATVDEDFQEAVVVEVGDQRDALARESGAEFYGAACSV